MLLLLVLLPLPAGAALQRFYSRTRDLLAVYLLDMDGFARHGDTGQGGGTQYWLIFVLLALQKTKHLVHHISATNRAAPLVKRKRHEAGTNTNGYFEARNDGNGAQNDEMTTLNTVR